MRVIAGIYKGRKLRSPENHDIRPTSDKTKEAMFSMLTGRTEGARVLDLFAGSGALGIEALSRGAKACVFVDSSRAAVRLIKENLAGCGIGEEATVRTGDYRRVLETLEGTFDIIFMDPPYDKGLAEEAFRLIDEGELLAPDGILIAEHGKNEDYPEEIHGLFREKERRYGICKCSIYRCYTPDDMV